MQLFLHICLACMHRVQHLSCIHMKSLTPILHASAEFNTCLAFRFQHLFYIHMQSLTPVLHISAEFNTCPAFKCRVQHLSDIQVQSSYIQVQSSTPVSQTSAEFLHTSAEFNTCAVLWYAVHAGLCEECKHSWPVQVRHSKYPLLLLTATNVPMRSVPKLLWPKCS